MPDSLENAALRVGQSLNLGGLLIAAGGGIFLLAIWRSSVMSTRWDSVEARFMSGWRRMVLVAWIVAALGSIPLLIWTESQGVEWPRLALLFGGGITGSFATGRTGPARLFRTPRARRGDRNSDRVSAWPSVLAAVALFLLLLSAAMTGHARSSPLPFPNLLVALVHVTAAAAWLGGLVALVAVAFPAARDEEEAERPSLLVPLVARFSDLALWAVVAIVASGTYSAWIEIGWPRNVTASTYGLVFLAKLGAFLPALALGAVNNRWTKPRLWEAVRGNTSGSSALLILRRLVALEIALIAVILALTAFLLQLSPPTSRGSAP